MTIKAKYRQRYQTVPYALTPGGELVTVKEADPTKRYRCPECKGIVQLRKRKQNVHFYHLHKARCVLGQSALIFAKHVLHLVFIQWLKKDGNPIEVQNFISPSYELSKKLIHSIELDHRVRLYPNRSLHSHLTLLNRYHVPILHIEIREKARKRSIRDSTWLSVSAEEVLNNPYRLSSLDLKQSSTDT